MLNAPKYDSGLTDEDGARWHSRRLQKKKNGNTLRRCRWNRAYGTDESNEPKGLLYSFAGGVEDLAVRQENEEMRVAKHLCRFRKALRCGERF